MPLDVQYLTWHMSGVSTAGTPQPDPNACLGGRWSSTKLEDAESTVTSATNFRVFVDSTQIGQSHVGKILLFVDGNNEGQASEVTAFNTSTGEFTCMLEAFTNTPGIGDRYRLYIADGLFSPFTTTMSQADQAVHRLVYCRNQTGSDDLDAPRSYITVNSVRPGPFLLEIAHGAASGQINPNIAYIASQIDAPNIIGGDTQFTSSTKPQTWRREYGHGVALFTPNIHAAGNQWSLDDTWARPLWLRLRMVNPELISPAMDKAFFVVTLESTESGGNPDPIATRFCVVVSIVVNEQVTIAAERKLRTFGGSRIDVNVVDADTGVGLSERRAVLELVAPSPGTLNQPYEIVTDANGYIAGVYLSPEDEGEVGETVELKVGVN